MIAVVKPQSAGLMHRAVPKRRHRGAKAQHLQRRFVRHSAQSYNRAQSWHGLDRRRQKCPAAIDLGGQRLVLWRHAAYRVADPAIDQREPVIGYNNVSQSVLVAAPGTAGMSNLGLVYVDLVAA